MVITLIENTGEETLKYNRNHNHCQSPLNAANRFRDKTMYYNIQDTRSGILMFPFQKFQTNKFSSQEVKVRPFLNNDH